MPFKKGEISNPNGRPRRPEIELVRLAIEETNRQKKKSLWKHLIEQCYEDNNVLIAVAKKFMPDMVQDVSDRRQIIIEITNEINKIELTRIDGNEIKGIEHANGNGK